MVYYRGIRVLNKKEIENFKADVLSIMSWYGGVGEFSDAILNCIDIHLSHPVDSKPPPNVESIFPANDFKFAADTASEEIKCGLIIGYDENGELCAYLGGMINHAQPRIKDALWMIESFKTKMMNGDFLI